MESTTSSQHVVPLLRGLEKGFEKWDAESGQTFECDDDRGSVDQVIGPFAHWALQGEQFSQHGRREKKRSWNVPWQDKAEKTSTYL